MAKKAPKKVKSSSTFKVGKVSSTDSPYAGMTVFGKDAEQEDVTPIRATSKRKSSKGKSSKVVTTPITSSKGWKVRCHETHAELPFGKGVVLGGSCLSPRPGYDIYVGFDYGMRRLHSEYPWKPTTGGPVEFAFLITDMHAPTDAAEFANLIAWLAEQLENGKRVHMGCIGGHGRTGLVIAALAAVMLKEVDAITWARANHCAKAVESTSQVNFLVKHYGVLKVEPTKGAMHYGSYDGGYAATGKGNYANDFYPVSSTTGVTTSGNRKVSLYQPVLSPGSIW